MNFASRYTSTDGDIRPGAIVRDVLASIAMLIAVIVLWPLHIVPTGHRGVITSGGAIQGVEGEGWTVVLPIIHKLNIFSIRAEAAEVPAAEGATSDTQPVHVTLTVRYAIQVSRVSEIFEKYSKDGNLDSYVATATREAFKAVTARFSAPDLIAKRSEVSAGIVELLRKKLNVYGAEVISVDVTSFVFSKAYMDSIGNKVLQDQLLQTAEKKALTVVAEQKQKVAIAEAEATALRAKADGEAYANLAIAKAEAQALQVKGEATARAMEAQARALSANPALVEMRKAEAWDGKLPTAIYAGAPIPFLNTTK